MDEIIKFIQDNPHTILYYDLQGDRLCIYTIYNELINIKPLKIKNKPGFFEVIITTIDGTDCDYQAYTLDIIDIFKLLNDYVCNFYRGYVNEEDMEDIDDEF